MRTLENSDRQSLFAEALTTHGTGLARLRSYSAALTTFRRALDLSQHIGGLHCAADVALTIFREMGDRLAVVERAKSISGRTLSEQVQSLEHELIKHALEETKGSVTYAARNLGMPYQPLTYMQLALN